MKPPVDCVPDQEPEDPSKAKWEGHWPWDVWSWPCGFVCSDKFKRTADPSVMQYAHARHH